MSHSKTNHYAHYNLVAWLLALWALALVVIAAAVGWAVIKHVRSGLSTEPVAWLSADALPSSYPDPVCEMCGQVLNGRDISCEGGYQ